MTYIFAIFTLDLEKNVLSFGLMGENPHPLISCVHVGSLWHGGKLSQLNSNCECE